MAITTPVNVIDRAAERARSQTRPSGIDRFVERIGISLLHWSHARASRTVLSHDENAQKVHMREMELQREAEAIRLSQRMGL